MMDSDIKEMITASWNISAKSYDNSYAHGIKSSEEEIQWSRALKKILGEEKKKILDVGTGTGFLALLLATLGHDVKGVDISEGMMNEARKKAKNENLSISFEYGDAENLNEPDNTFDIVINRHIFWTMQYPEKALKEWIRVLKPGGRLVVIDGDWFYRKTTYSISIFLGRLLVLLTEFRNPWRHAGSYDTALKEKLPMMRDKNARNTIALIQKCGLKELKVYGLEEVEKAERKAMPFKERLLNPHKRIVMECTKS